MPRPKERRRIVIAVLVSLLVHLGVAFSLASFGGAFTPPVEEEKVPELTLVEPPPEAPAPVPLVPPNPGFIENDESKAAPSPPPEKTFESNANSIAASKNTANGESALPAQDGKQRPFMDLKTQAASLASKGGVPQPDPEKILEPIDRPTETATPIPTPPPRARATPAPTMAPTAPPTAAPTATPVATPQPTPESTPQVDALAMLTSTPPPPLPPSEMTQPSAIPELETPTPRPTLPPRAPPRPKPVRPNSAYQPQKEETRITGRITNRGPSAVNAIETPMGKYKKAVSDAIGSRWYFYVGEKMDLVSVGTASVSAEISPEGKVEHLRVVSNSANESFANICLQSFQEAQIPPIPEELISTLPGGRLPVDFTFTAYSNQ